MACKISKGLAYIITLYNITSLISVHHHSIQYNLFELNTFDFIEAIPRYSFRMKNSVTPQYILNKSSSF